MTNPFDIEEIFPGEAATAVRLPRRQSGNAPQGLTVSLLADYTARTRAWLPSAAIVALLGDAGVSLAGARTALSRLARRGSLESRRQGRNSFYRLTEPTAAYLSRGGMRVAASGASSTQWDESWTLIAFSLPQEESAQRRALRGHLRWLGFAPLYDGLWISAFALGEEVRARLAEVGLGAVTVFQARHVDVPSGAGRSPIEAWDIAAIAAEYESFLRRWEKVVPRIQTGQITGADAVHVRTESMDTYRRFSVIDPELPLQLLPARWLRRPVRELFMAVYDGLAEAAEDHVRTVVTRHATDPQPKIRAHTVAELLAGVQPDLADDADTTWPSESIA